MKKLLLIGALAVGSINLAQAQAYGTKIGQTYYDLQSNYSSANRIVRAPNGGISATWTESCNSDPATCPNCPYVTRGAGYNYLDPNTGNWIHGSDGTCDESGADFGVFSARVGWPEIVVFPDGREMIIAHTPFVSVSRPQAGQGGMSAWTANTPLPTPPPASGVETNSWPRVVNSGNTLHMIATCQPCTTTTGVISPLAYWRSTNQGASWDIQNQLLPGMDSTNFANISADSYAIHARGNTVAIIAGSGGNDWTLWKSTDGGDNWTTTDIREYSINDTVNIGSAQYAGYETNDAYMSVLIDHNNKVHAWAGYILGGVDKFTTPMEYSVYYPLASEGIWYWNDGMPANSPQLIVTEREDIHSDPASGDWIGDGSYVTPALRSPYGGGLLNMPNAAIDASGNIYLVYSGIVEGTSDTGDSTGQSFRDLYVMHTMNGGTTWSTPQNIAMLATGNRTDFEEEVFPSVVKEIGSDNMLHMIFQHDDAPGLHVRIDYDAEVLNSIVHHSINVTTLAANEVNNYVRGMNVYPNPTTGKTQLQVDLIKDASVSVRVTNLLGQEVISQNAANRVAGSHTIELDLSKQPSGVYLYTITADGYSKTQRLVKE